MVFAGFVLSHILQVYLWAFGIWLVGALRVYEAPIYLALATYTTLGHGDVTLGPEFRIIGAMGSVTGILMFGLTTAFLVGMKIPKNSSVTATTVSSTAATTDKR